MKSIKPVSIAVGAVAVGAVLFAYWKNHEHEKGHTSTPPAIAAVNSSVMNSSVAPAAYDVHPSSGQTAAQPAHSAGDPANAANDGQATEYSLEMRIDLMQARREGQTFDPVAVDSAVQQPAAWAADPAIADGLALDDKERYDGREFIRFSPLKLESLMPGDEMEIPLAQENSTYQMVVDKVDVFPDGNVTWHGHLKDFPQENQVSFTRGKDLTVGSITIPDKQFSLQVEGEKGWVVNSFTLFKGHDEHLFPAEGDPHDTQDQNHPHHHDDES